VFSFLRGTAAFAAARRCCWAPGAAAVDRYLHAGTALSSKPAAAASE